MFVAPCWVSGCASVPDSTKEMTPGTRGVTLKMASIGEIQKKHECESNLSEKLHNSDHKRLN